MKTTLISLFFLMLGLFACSNGGNFEQASDARDKTAMPPMTEDYSSDGQAPAPGTITVIGKKVIRNGNMSITVKNAQETRNALEAILKSHDAYVGNENLTNSDYQTLYTIQIRVKADQLDGLVRDIEAIEGTVNNKNIAATDVTEEYIDLDSRLTNKRAYLEQYRALLKNAKSIEDILKVQEQIRMLEEEIESVAGRLKYLSSQVELSTLDLSIIENKDFVYRDERRINFGERFKQSLSQGWYGFVQFLIYMMMLWPFWLILIAIVWGYLRWTKRKKVKT